MMIVQEKMYQNICAIKIILNALAQIYQDKQINFTEKLEEDGRATMFFIAENQQKIF